MTPPLDGITVVALEQAVAAPFASRQLADLGARVIKIERPGTGDFARHYDTTVKGLCSHFVWLNRSKESLTLDLKAEGARPIVERLVGQADIFLHNLAPGAVERLGFGPAELREHHPRLIACRISGYGTSGPYRNHKAYDLLIQADAGFLSITGTEEAPAKAGIPVADIAAGMYAYSGILSALFLRSRTNQGTVIEVSLLEALAEWMGYPALYTGYGGTPPKRTGASHPAIVPYEAFRCADGAQVYLGIQNEREWKRFCEEVLGTPELATDARFISNTARVAHREELRERVDEVFGSLSGEQVLERLDKAQIAGAQMRTVEEFLEHPQLEARSRWREVDSSQGPLRILRPPVDLKGFEPTLGAVPELGEHTDAILTELGFDSESIADLRAQQVI